MKQNFKDIVLYKALKSYVRGIHNRFFYSDFKIINRKNIPKKGTPTIVVCDHQNCINDPFAINCSISDRKVYFLARADVFDTPVRKLLLWAGLIPAFRADFEGIDAVDKNRSSFEIVEDCLLKGNTVAIYPEAKHQDKRWLGDFSTGYLRIAFNAAEKSGFQQEIYILPSCNHYSDYYPPRGKALVKYGEPIPLSPYYELYKTKPRTAQRNVNRIVRQQVNDLMLNITDLDNYNTIDFIRESYGVHFAAKNGFNYNKLPQKLEADKMLVEKLDAAKVDNPEKLSELYEGFAKLQNLYEELDVTDREVSAKRSIMGIILDIIILVLFLPLYVAGFLLNAPIHYLPSMLFKPKDTMFSGGIYLCISLFVTIPLLYGVYFVVLLSYMNALMALVCLLMSMLLGVAAWNYYQFFKTTKQKCRLFKMRNKKNYVNMSELREKLFMSADFLINEVNK